MAEIAKRDRVKVQVICMFRWLGARAFSHWSRKRLSVIELDSIYSEMLTADGFAHLYETQRDSIASVQLVPGRLGSNYFGGFLVHHKHPVYTLGNDDLVC
ncbi:MAG TPA: hypothetical protein VF075_02555 [Pyrinomonadaceae bacterium]